MKIKKHVYSFGDGKAEGNAGMRDFLGGKGANLAEMTGLGIPVPPGFTISTEACEVYYENNQKHPQELLDQVDQALLKLEKTMGKKLGDPNDPLLVSVRSGAAVSMPGMMDTVLNLGLTEEGVKGLAKLSGNEKFAWDSYRRFIQMFGNVVKNVSSHYFESILEKIKEEKGLRSDTDLTAEDLRRVVAEYKKLYKERVKEDFPGDAKDQLWQAINAVFNSWNNDRAIRYRQINKITGLLGTGVNIQSMVFGNFGDTSGTGVCFSRDPSTGENYFYGEYLMNAQGEDVVAGIRTPAPLATLESANPEIYRNLSDIKNKLEHHYKDMQDMEFTIQEGRLFILQTRNGKRTGLAAVNIAYDLVQEGLLTKEEALMRIEPEQLNQFFHPQISPALKEKLTAIAKGLNASPGAAVGQIAFTAEQAETMSKKKKVILVRKETSPEDIGGMYAAEGILTSTGGMTSHAAVVARGMGTPCVAGCQELRIDAEKEILTVNDRSFKTGDWISIDGNDGAVYGEKLQLEEALITQKLSDILLWSDEIRRNGKRPGVGTGFEVRMNADLPQDAQKGLEFGAEGIGLCRTEHMFFDEEKLESFRKMILSDSPEERKKSLKKIIELQIEDFAAIFRVMQGLPVNIRLLDPPLHEFLPNGHEEIKNLAENMKLQVHQLKVRIDSMHELNPMLGHRGCRLGITAPEIYEAQTEAILRAAVKVKLEGKQVSPEIMIPLVGLPEELKYLREKVQNVIRTVLDEAGTEIPVKIGTMIEVPRSAILADKIAPYADYFSFGTNDMTQMTYGFSRDDAGGFIMDYREKGILKHDPFESLDQEGVGALVQMAVEKGRSAKENLKTSICGEHGGESESIEFCYRREINTVSCSPFRVPIARLAAAQAVIRNTKR